MSDDSDFEILEIDDDEEPGAEKQVMTDVKKTCKNCVNCQECQDCLSCKNNQCEFEEEYTLETLFKDICEDCFEGCRLIFNACKTNNDYEF